MLEGKEPEKFAVSLGNSESSEQLNFSWLRRSLDKYQDIPAFLLGATWVLKSRNSSLYRMITSCNGLADSLLRTRKAILAVPLVSLNNFSLPQSCSANGAALLGRSPFSIEQDCMNLAVVRESVDPCSWSTLGANGPLRMRSRSETPINAGLNTMRVQEPLSAWLISAHLTQYYDPK